MFIQIFVVKANLLCINIITKLVKEVFSVVEETNRFSAKGRELFLSLEG